MIRFEGIVINRQARSIMRDGHRIYLRRTFFRLGCALLLGGWLPKQALFDLLYGDREDGGPDSGPKIVEIMMSQMKPRFARIGLEIRASGPYGRKRYRAMPTAISLPEVMEAAE